MFNDADEELTPTKNDEHLSNVADNSKCVIDKKADLVEQLPREESVEESEDNTETAADDAETAKETTIEDCDEAVNHTSENSDPAQDSSEQVTEISPAETSEPVTAAEEVQNLRRSQSQEETSLPDLEEVRDQSPEASLDSSLPPPPPEDTTLDCSLPPPPQELLDNTYETDINSFPPAPDNVDEDDVNTVKEVSPPLPSPERDLPDPPAESDPEFPAPPREDELQNLSSLTPASFTLPPSSPAVSKPTAVVKPCYQEAVREHSSADSNELTDNKVTSESPPSHNKCTETVDNIVEKNQFLTDTAHTAPDTDNVQEELRVREVHKMDTDDQEEIIPPSKGYNLDFLDNLDDPNFNPFETKSSVKVCFDESAPVAGAALPPPPSGSETRGSDSSSVAEESKPVKKPVPKKPWLKSKKKTETDSTESSDKPKKVSKPLPPKPWLKKKPVQAEEAASVNEEPAKEEAEEIKVPSKGYNLDFLDNLDDPSLNPFETKTAIVNNFDNSSPDTVEPAPVTEETKVVEEVKEVKQDEAEKVVKKVSPVKPWQRKKVNKPKVEKETIEQNDEEEAKVPTKGYNLDFLDNLDDPNFNPFETKTAVINNFDANEPMSTNSNVEEEPKLDDEPVEEVEETQPTPAESDIITEDSTQTQLTDQPDEPVEEEEPVKVPSKGYNLDFLDNLDDPNFNPFETKSSVVNKFDELSQDVPQISSENSVEAFEHENSSQIDDKKTSSEDKLDLQDKLDDPNFKPLETKTQLDEADESVADTTLTLDAGDDEHVTPADTNSSSSPPAPAPMLTPAAVEARPESPQSNSSGYSSIPPAPEPVINMEELISNNTLTNTMLDSTSNMTMSDITTSNMTMTDLLTNQSQITGDLGQLAKMGLLHEERLLEKDKEVSRLNSVVREKQAEIDQLRIKLEMHQDNNNQMTVIVDEFEKTIQQLIQEKEKNQVKKEFNYFCFSYFHHISLPGCV